MNDKKITTTTNADGKKVTVIADSAAALAAAVTAKKLDKIPTRPNILMPGDGNKMFKDFN